MADETKKATAVEMEVKPAAAAVPAYPAHHHTVTPILSHPRVVPILTYPQASFAVPIHLQQVQFPAANNPAVMTPASTVSIQGESTGQRVAAPLPEKHFPLFPKPVEKEAEQAALAF